MEPSRPGSSTSSSSASIAASNGARAAPSIPGVPPPSSMQDASSLLPAAACSPPPCGLLGEATEVPGCAAGIGAALSRAADGVYGRGMGGGLRAPAALASSDACGPPASGDGGGP